MKSCPECHHLPSERTTEQEGGYHATCYCPCHTLADGAPTLREALRRIALLPHNAPFGDALHTHCAQCIAKKALAEAAR